ncbi:unnamed protein product [Rotaria sordida]|uniref:VCBS repeat-containing protein n=1 Tax=Rotaria sordida TaxID=392033 RepID=A0A815RYM1_9BILA|nr:unnamed protein product [Rotaria sordida]
MTYTSGGASRLRGVALADMNNDTETDIIVANYGTNNIGVLLGYGNGTFTSQIILYTAPNSHPLAVSIADFNGDNYSDIAMPNYLTKTVDILLGTEKGAFIPQVNYGIGSLQAFVLVSGDFNNDGRSDIVVGYDSRDTLSVLSSYNPGSFQNQMKYSTGSRKRSDSPKSRSVAVGDFNNDTRLDIVVVNSGSNNVSVLLGYGNGSFQNQMTYSTGSYPQSVAVGDFNNDTRLDIVVANSNSPDVSVLLGYGNGSFQNQMTYSTGNWPQSVAVGDFNNDTRLDIVVSNYISNVSVLLGYGNGSFQNQMTYSTGSYPRSVAVGDFNNDTRLDIVVANDDTNDVSILLGYANEVFVSQTILTSGNGSQPRSFVVNDFNNDGCMDIGVANSGTDNIGIFLGYGNFSFASPTIYPTGPNSSPYGVAAGDFNNDTYIDIVVANYGSNNIGIFLGMGNGSFANQTTYSTDSSPYSAAVGDFDNDCILDIIISNYENNNLGVLRGYGNGAFGSIVLIQLKYGTHPFSVLVDDLNNDGKLDLIVANNGTDNLQVFVQTC